MRQSTTWVIGGALAVGLLGPWRAGPVGKASTVGPRELSLGWDGDRGALQVRGTAVPRADRLRIYPARADLSDPTYPPVAGTFRTLSDGSLHFLPRYTLPTGEAFVAVIGGGRVDHVRSEALTVPPAAPRHPARVLATYPTAKLLPANQLKMYVEFSRPMRRWDPYDQVTLVDETTGAVVEDAFQALRDGLWDPSATRLTMVFDPGRVKRGLSTNEALGPPLVRGHEYRLEIASTWRDAGGRELGESHTARFRVGEPDRQRPLASAWSVSAPAAGTRDPVVVDFHESMDRALLGSMIAVLDADRVHVPHDAGIGFTERSWSAIPVQPWRADVYRVVVDCRMEDLAGNNVERLFDVDLVEDGAMPESEDGDCEVELPFTVSGGP